MNRLFIKDEDQVAFENNGYIILDILREEAIQCLHVLYADTIAQQEKTGLFESSRNNSPQVNTLIHQRIQEILEPYVQNIFIDYSFYGGTFMIKASSGSGEFPFHQDWNIVDEQKHTALFFWIPLVKTDIKNGAIFLIKGSHKFFNNFRSGSYTSRMIERKKIIPESIETISLRPGEVLIYLPQLFHGSYKNHTSKDRLAVTAMITDKDCPLYNYNKKDESTAAVYQLSPQSYLNDIRMINDGKIPGTAAFIDTIPYIHHTINHTALNKAITGKEHGIWQQIKTRIQHILA